MVKIVFVAELGWGFDSLAWLNPKRKCGFFLLGLFANADEHLEQIEEMKNQSIPSGLLKLFCVGLFCIGISACKSANEDGSNSNGAAKVQSGSNLIEYKYGELHPVQDFSLTGRDGNPVELEDLKGKVWIASFFFSNCKFECSQQNQTISDEVHSKLLGKDFVVVSFTCDPENDTPKVLADYAKQYVVAEDKWHFVTGPLPRIQAVAEESFKVAVDPSTHTKRLLLVDKWGRFRDAFEWKEPQDLIRLRQVANLCLNEESKPDDDVVMKSRALPHDLFVKSAASSGTDSPHEKAGNSEDTSVQRDPDWPAWRNEDWLTSFELTDTSGIRFRSKDMVGKVWVANFFFSSCPGACPKLLNQIKELRAQLGDRDVTFVSLTNDPDTDTPEVLKEYAKKYRSDDKWKFLTGTEQLQMRAIGSEFFDVNAGTGESHSEKLIVVDKWNKVRGQFHVHKPEEMIQFRILLDELLKETEPKVNKK